MEALALAPGIPDLEAQEKRDRAAAGTYSRLEAAGILQVAEGLQVQPPVAAVGNDSRGVGRARDPAMRPLQDQRTPRRRPGSLPN